MGIDFSNPTIQTGTISASALILCAILTVLMNIYLKGRDEFIQAKKSREEELREKAHEGIETKALIVHDLAAYRKDLREEYAGIVNTLQVRLAAAELQINEQALNLAKCQDNHKISVESMTQLTLQLEDITERLSRYEIKAVLDDEYIQQLQVDLTSAGIPIRLRVKND